MGEPFRIVARFSVIDTSFKSKDTFDKLHDLAKTHLEESHDVFVHKESPSLGLTIVYSPIPLIILMLPLFVHYPLLPSSITLMCTSIIP